MNSDVMFSSSDDTWTTPIDLWNVWNEEFQFTLDAAALSTSALCESWYGPDHPDATRRDALTRNWLEDSNGGSVWMNPPYGRRIKRFMEKANSESSNGLTVVCLVPARTDTVWWHSFAIHHEVRFLRGRIKFGNSKNGAPFPSALVVMKKAGYGQ